MAVMRRFRRNLFTDVIEEVYDDVVAELQPLNASSQEKVAWMARKTYKNPYDTGCDHVNRGMSLTPEEATPQRVAAENAAARQHGTGAYYTPDGLCHVPTRGARAREMRRRGHQDNDAGYGDWGGR